MIPEAATRGASHTGDRSATATRGEEPIYAMLNCRHTVNKMLFVAPPHRIVLFGVPCSRAGDWWPVRDVTTYVHKLVDILGR